MRPIGLIVAQSGAHKSCKLIDLTVSFSTYGQLYLLTRPKVEIFKRPKNRKDGSKFDDFRTKKFAAARAISWKKFERTRRTKSCRKIRKKIENFLKVFSNFFRPSISTKNNRYKFHDRGHTCKTGKWIALHNSDLLAVIKSLNFNFF